MKFNSNPVTGRFGVEIEFNSRRGRQTSGTSPGELARLMTAAGVPTVDHSAQYRGAHETRATWKIVPDGSVPLGWELVSPPLSGIDARAQIQTVCRILRENGCYVNRSTGLHVHHDASDMTSKHLANVAEIYKAHQPTIDEMVSPSRRNTGYARNINGFRHWEIASMRANTNPAGFCGVANGGGRMFVVNFNAYLRHGTVEFRQHQGSLNATKIWNWVVFTQAIMSRARARRSKAPAQRSADQFRPEHAGQVGLFRELQMLVSADRDEITYRACKGLAQRFPHPLWRDGGDSEGVEITEAEVRRTERERRVGEAHPIDVETPPECPQCSRTMVVRTVSPAGGRRAGTQFWGCTNYPTCRGTRSALN